MTDCRIEIYVVMVNVPDDKRDTLIDKIRQNVIEYQDTLDCEINVEALSRSPQTLRQGSPLSTAST